MYHLVARARRDRLLFDDPVEARALWVRVTAATPGLTAMCLMPNHVHLLHARDVKLELGQAMSAFTRWRNAHRGERGSLLERSPEPEWIAGEQKIRRQIRYIHLNPCRARLVDDPVAWPFSTHLDALGLAIPGVRPKVSDPYAFHRYVSADGTVEVAGTDLPCPPVGLLTLEQVLWGVSAAMRVPADEVLGRRGAARRVFIGNARALAGASCTEVARFAGISTRTVERVRPLSSVPVAALGADPRLQGWENRVTRRRQRPRWYA